MLRNLENGILPLGAPQIITLKNNTMCIDIKPRRHHGGNIAIGKKHSVARFPTNCSNNLTFHF